MPGVKKRLGRMNVKVSLDRGDFDHGLEVLLNSLKIVQVKGYPDLATCCHVGTLFIPEL